MQHALAAALLASLLLSSAVPGMAPPGPGPGDAVAAPLGIPRAVDPMDPLAPLERFHPRAPGAWERLAFTYGPLQIPGGWDFSRLLVDVPLHTGFVTQLEYRLVDALTGEEPTNMEVHVHHALWFPVAKSLLEVDFAHFLFGTGEERTRVDLDARSDAGDPEGDGPRYGIPLERGEHSRIVLMLHNKEARPRLVTLRLDVAFVHGTAQAIENAHHCGQLPLVQGSRCYAGAEFRGLEGSLWGTIYDVPAEAPGNGGDGVDVFPRDDPLGLVLEARVSGTMVFGQGHLHPGGMGQVVANLGPAGSGCEADLDGDGYPGTTLLRPAKFDRVPEAWPFSEEFQMGVTQPGFRALVRQGDRIAQFGIYANAGHASWDAMTYATLYVDPAAAPPPLAPEAGCRAADMAPRLVDDPHGDPMASVMNRAWDQPALPVCGIAGAPACDVPAEPRAAGSGEGVVVIADFLYLPGDLSLGGDLGRPPRVEAGASLRFVNADGAAVVRHTVTSCAWPCNGPYRANHPLPDGAFESEQIFNTDFGDEGSVPPVEGEDDPVWESPPDLEPGMYSYFCRLHPWMRGAFEVVAPG